MNARAPSDTSTESANLQYRLLSRAGPAERFRKCREMTAHMIALSRRALARARPDLGPADLAIEWVAIHYGVEIAEGMRRRRRATT